LLRTLALVLVLVLVLVLACAGSALAGHRPTGSGLAASPRAPATLTTSDPNALNTPPSMHKRPAKHRLTGLRAQAIASAIPKVRDAVRRHHGAYPVTYLKGPLRWQVSYFAHNQEIVQVLIDDASGKVLESWTGHQVAWSMARGYPGAFGRKANSLYIWITLSLLFVVPFVNPRRLFSLLHLDLLVLSAFSVSLAFFNQGNIDASVPLAYPPLVYLLGRMLWAARRPRPDRPPPDPLRLFVPASWLAVGVIFLLGFRVGLNVTDSNVIDVGYAGVIGADHIAHGQAIYGHFPQNNQHGDTYGPAVYEAYVPFEQALGWTGTWDDLPAAHAAAIVFDLLCVALLYWLGRRVRGPTLGIALAYAWAAYPFTLFAAQTNTNDSLVAAVLIGSLIVAARPAARGALAAVAGLTKFAPLALAPLMATHGLTAVRASPQQASGPGEGPGRPTRRWRGLALFVAGFLLAGALVMAPVLLGDDLRRFYDQTIAYQSERGSPFSVWGLYGLSDVQLGVQVAGLLFALLAAVIPRRPDVIGLAAMSAAVLIALQLAVTHWFYLYLVWFLPLVLLVLLGRGHQDLLDRVSPQRPGGANEDSHQPGVVV
jgi:hypothetical protein